MHDTHAARAAQGRGPHLRPDRLHRAATHRRGRRSRASRTWEGARRTAASLLGVGDQRRRALRRRDFWRPAGARYLAPLLLAAAHGDLTMREVLAWIAAIEEDEPTELLERCRDPGARPALEALRSVWEADPRFRSSLLQTSRPRSTPGRSRAIAAATIGDSQITAELAARRRQHAVPDLPGRRPAPPARPLHRARRRHHRRRVRALHPDRQADRPAAAARAG